MQIKWNFETDIFHKTSSTFFIFTKRKIRYCFAQPEQHCLKCFPYIALNLVIDFVLWYNPNRKFESQRMTNISHFQLCNNPTPYLKWFRFNGFLQLVCISTYLHCELTTKIGRPKPIWLFWATLFCHSVLTLFFILF